MVVDDSAVMRKMVERSIRDAGIQVAEVLEAGDGWEALALAQQKMPDLVLCDINMPTMDGLEFVRALKSHAAATRVAVVMITTEGSEARMAEAEAAGATGYVRKPFTIEQIRSQVVPLVEAL
jgi:two-component system chemotaxis response regulator CheY